MLRRVLSISAVSITLALLVGCSRTPSTPTPAPTSPTGSQPAAGPQQAGSGGANETMTQSLLSELGIKGKPSYTTPRGLLVTEFISGPTESPLKQIGIKTGDVIISCNGGSEQMGRRLPTAVKELQENGKAITCVVLRDGKEVTLTRTEKLPVAAK